MKDAEVSGSVPNFDRRKLLLGALAAASAGVVYARQPREKVDYLGSGKLDALIPKQVGQWEFATKSGLVVPPEDPLSDALYAQLLTRVYSDGASAPIMLLIAQSAGQTGLLQVHRPEVCYPAGGYQLSPVVTQGMRVRDSVVPANILTATLEGRVEQILYWTRVGDQMPASWAQQRLAVASDNLRGLIPDAVLVRVSTINPDAEQAFAHLTQFMSTMIGMMPSKARDVLIA